MRSYTDYLQWKEQEYPGIFDASFLDIRFIPYYENQQRIRIVDCGDTRTGRVSVTTGWRPSFLLVHRSSDRGSAILLSPNTTISAVQRGKKYSPISA